MAQPGPGWACCSHRVRTALPQLLGITWRQTRYRGSRPCEVSLQPRRCTCRPSTSGSAGLGLPHPRTVLHPYSTVPGMTLPPGSQASAGVHSCQCIPTAQASSSGEMMGAVQVGWKTVKARGQPRGPAGSNGHTTPTSQNPPPGPASPPTTSKPRLVGCPTYS